LLGLFLQVPEVRLGGPRLPVPGPARTDHLVGNRRRPLSLRRGLGLAVAALAALSALALAAPAAGAAASLGAGRRAGLMLRSRDRAGGAGVGGEPGAVGVGEQVAGLGPERAAKRREITRAR